VSNRLSLSITFKQLAERNAPKCPRCHGEMEAAEVVLRLFSLRKRDNGIWATYMCKGKECIPLHIKLDTAMEREHGKTR
jgi:hypothetical protein